MLNSVVSKVSSVANTDVIAYQVPSGKKLANVSILVANPGASAAALTMGITTSGSLADADKLEGGLNLTAKAGSVRRTNIIMGPGEKIIVNSPSSDLAIRVYGLEEQ